MYHRMGRFLMAQTSQSDAPDARRVAAVLANDDMRTLYAEIVLGCESSLGAATRKKALAALLASGLVDSIGGADDADGQRVVASARVFRELLAQHPAPLIATGVDRFLHDGRIDRYPSSAHDRHELLEWVVARAIEPGEVLVESEVNGRLSRFSDDIAALRRYLMDAALLERTASGSTYVRVSRAPDARALGESAQSDAGADTLAP
jgi:hypothetical protein